MQRAHDLNLASIDLNLLNILDALLAERHVTRAARRVGLTQSAASHALARLRELLGDPLLVRGPGGTMLATARAEALAPVLRQALAALEAALRGEPAFDPVTAARTFHLSTGDYAELVVLPPLTAQLAAEAPSVDLWVHPTDEEPADQLAAGETDVALGVWRGRNWPAGIYEKRLFDETFVCVVRGDHPAVKQRLTLARYVALSHLLIAPRGTPGSFVDDALAAMGKRRRVAVAVPHFLVAPHVIAATDLVVTLASRIARAVAGPLGLAILEPPLELPGFTMAMAWHERAHRDPAQRWLRDRLLAIGAGA